jgi:hypothetical protein
MAEIDHLVVTAPTLAAASDWVEGILGVQLQAGGEHARMGTHNALLRLGDSAYLEAIATNPSAPRPERRRWFGLDELASNAPPRLTTWVARTKDIRAAARAVEPGLEDAIVPMSRGSFEWLITVPGDRTMPLSGVAPSLIEWRSPVHPATGLEDRGCRLVRVTARTPEPERLRAWLSALGLEDAVDVRSSEGGAGPSLVAEIETPTGARTLG